MNERTQNMLLSKSIEVDECGAIMRQLAQESMMESDPSITLVLLATKVVRCCGAINGRECRILSDTFFRGVERSLSNGVRSWGERTVAYALLIDTFAASGCAAPIEGTVREVQEVVDRLPTVKKLMTNFSGRSGLERASHNLVTMLNAEEEEKRFSLVSYVDYISVLYQDLMNAYPSKEEARNMADNVLREIDSLRDWSADKKTAQALNELWSDICP